MSPIGLIRAVPTRFCYTNLLLTRCASRIEDKDNDATRIAAQTRNPITIISRTPGSAIGVISDCFGLAVLRLQLTISSPGMGF
jgi:hypothetical protein